MKQYRVMVATGVLSLALGACLASATKAEGGLGADAVYKKNCAKCHGKNATGRHFGGPSLISEKVATASADDLRKVIAAGKGRMPKFAAKLAAEEIDVLVQEIQALNKK
jgi:mono/diheme cytochrome c family protein